MGEGRRKQTSSLVFFFALSSLADSQMKRKLKQRLWQETMQYQYLLIFSLATRWSRTLDSTLWILASFPGTGFRIPCQWIMASGFQSLAGLRIPCQWIMDCGFQSLAVFRIPCQWVMDSGFQSLAGFRIPCQWIMHCGLQFLAGFHIPCQWITDCGFQSLAGFRIPC